MLTTLIAASLSHRAFVGARPGARQLRLADLIQPISAESVEKNDTQMQRNALIMNGWRVRKKVLEKGTPGFVEAGAALPSRFTMSHRQPRAGERFSTTLIVVE